MYPYTMIPIMRLNRNNMNLKLLFLIISSIKLMCVVLSKTQQQCSGFEEWLQIFSKKLRQPFCPIDMKYKSLYILYDVNPPEGFNLRRDVYIRLAVFVRNLQYIKNFHNVHLVLPPWQRLYHWKSDDIYQDQISWSHFFNIESLKRFAPVLDYSEFIQDISLYGLQESPYIPIHKIVQLQHFKDMFTDGVFYDKWEFSNDCNQDPYLLERSYIRKFPLRPLESNVQCVRFQGYAKMLQYVLQKIILELNNDVKPKIVAILNAEVALHDQWASKQFWMARRSMRFADYITQLANEYRFKFLNSSNVMDGVQRPPMWELENALYHGKAWGGPYIAAHLRRADFLYGREHTTPSLKSAALQVKYYLQQYNLSTIYLATDANIYEVETFKSYLPHIQVFQYKIDNQQKKDSIKDGGLAIIDQLICAHARFFVGTYESTFTYRIYEEREILGFPSNTTFNTFCKKSTLENCSKNSIWSIVY